MHDTGGCVAETEAIYAMCEIQRRIIEKWINVNVTAGKVNAFAARDVKIARHFVQC